MAALESKYVPVVVNPKTAQIQLYDLCIVLFGEREANKLLEQHGAFCQCCNGIESADDACGLLLDSSELDPSLREKIESFRSTDAFRRLEQVRNIVKTKRDLRAAIKACEDASNQFKRTFLENDEDVDQVVATLRRRLVALSVEFGNEWRLEPVNYGTK